MFWNMTFNCFISVSNSLHVTSKTLFLEINLYLEHNLLFPVKKAIKVMAWVITCMWWQVDLLITRLKNPLLVQWCQTNRRVDGITTYSSIGAIQPIYVTWCYVTVIKHQCVFSIKLMVILSWDLVLGRITTYKRLPMRISMFLCPFLQSCALSTSQGRFIFSLRDILWLSQSTDCHFQRINEPFYLKTRCWGE